MSESVRRVAAIGTQATERARADILFTNAPIGIIASGAMGLVAAGAFYLDDQTLARQVMVWSVLLALGMAGHLFLCFAYRKRTNPAPSVWVNAFVVAALFEGVVWGVGTALFADPDRTYRQLIMLVLSSGIVTSTAFVQSTHVAPFRAFFLPAIVPHLYFQALYPYPLHFLTVAMTAAFLVSIAIAFERSHAQFLDALRMRFENEGLAAALMVERDRAEDANLAKSRFLAAASHDLRQPVHALGLFVGALQNRALDQPTQRIVENIEQSVASLDDLFSTLLDITKFDAGGVVANKTTFPLAPLLLRLSHEYRQEASLKNLDLRLVPTTLWVQTDAVLLERAIRNLLSNAIKYTDRGRVVLGCRRQKDRVCLTVADSGIGIPPDHLEKIFEEFHQINNPERDRSRGTGLGLAIVKRILPLISGSLTVSSKQGCGTVFRLGVQRAEPSVDDTGEVQAPAASVADFGLVAVLDDEDQVRRALSLLLRGWGYSVVTGGSVKELLTALAQQNARPVALISDYRLRDHETGTAAIAQIRARYCATLPALLITGDIAAGSLVEAQADAVFTLHKPVQPGHLRAALRNLVKPL